MPVRAVWSFWSKPFYANYGHAWGKPLHHLLAWGLSVEAASRHYRDTMLVTDRAGKKLLVEQLGLQFSRVSTELDSLDPVDPGWWALGKIVAYSLQDLPFIHLDADVFLWKALPRHVTDAPVFTQCPEFHSTDTRATLRYVEAAFAHHAAPLPPEWLWARSSGASSFREENCGIVGGQNVAFLRHYARSALDLVLDRENAPAWSRLPDKPSLNFSVEQFLLGACIDFHRSHFESPYGGIAVAHLFSSMQEACDFKSARRLGYTHLWGGSKSHPAVGLRLEQRARSSSPAFFRRCESLVKRADLPSST